MKPGCRILLGFIVFTLAPSLCAANLCAQGDGSGQAGTRAPAPTSGGDGDGTGQGGTGIKLEAGGMRAELSNICVNELMLRDLSDTPATPHDKAAPAPSQNLKD